MRLLRILLVAIVLLVGPGMALVHAEPKLTLSPEVGFGGYYRQRTLVPVTVQVENPGDAVKGVFRITQDAKPADALRDTFESGEVTIPKGTKQRYTYYVIPESFAKDLLVEFWAGRQLLVSAPIKNAKELYDTDRLVVVIGGSGSSFNYLNTRGVPVSEYMKGRPWAFQNNYHQSYYGRSSPSSSSTIGNLKIVYADGKALPGNPEAYGSISAVALMSDVTENTLALEAQEALPLWVASGGHLLIAGGGVASRFSAPFFTQVLPLRNGLPLPGAAVRSAPGAGTVITGRLGSGWVTSLSFDPDATAAFSSATTDFIGKLAARAPATPVISGAHDAISNAILPRNLKPPDLKMIIIYLLLYLVLLVPVNYFILKKLDKREFAWVTAPAIVFLFTFGTYGIGYLTKGNQLITNMVSIVETSANQPQAQAISQLLIFSPSRTNYRLGLGEAGVLAREVERNDYYGRDERRTSPLHYVQGNELVVDRVAVNMWDFRHFALQHKVNLGKGFSANITPGKPASTPRATGTVTNGTPYTYALCELYQDSALVATFALAPGETVDVVKAVKPTPKFTPDEEHIYTQVQQAIKTQASPENALGAGAVLVAYTVDPKARPTTTISGKTPSAAITVMAVHLSGN